MSAHPASPSTTQMRKPTETETRSFSDTLLAALVPAVKELTGVMRQLAEELAAQRQDRDRAEAFRREVRESVHATLAARQ